MTTEINTIPAGTLNEDLFPVYLYAFPTKLEYDEYVRLRDARLVDMDKIGIPRRGLSKWRRDNPKLVHLIPAPVARPKFVLRRFKYFVTRTGIIVKNDMRTPVHVSYTSTNRNWQGVAYPLVYLKDHVTNRTINVNFHALMAHSFIALPTDLPYDQAAVDHINGNPMDNRLENLRWVTRSLNTELGRCAQRRRNLEDMFMDEPGFDKLFQQCSIDERRHGVAQGFDTPLLNE